MNKQISRIFIPTLRLPGVEGEFAIINSLSRKVKPMPKFIPLSKSITLIQAFLQDRCTKGWKYDYITLCKLEITNRNLHMWAVDTNYLGHRLRGICELYNIPETANMGWHQVVLRNGRMNHGC